MKRIVKQFLIITFWIIIWFLFSLIIDNELLFPSPILVIIRLFELVLTANFWIITLTSLFRVMLGIIVAILIGAILGGISAKFTLFHNLISPLMTIIKATPVASFIILIVLFIGKDIVPSFISSLMVIPIVWENVYTGFKGINMELVEVSKIYSFSFRKQCKTIYFPSVLPYFISAVMSSIGLGWKAGIAAEILYPPILSIGKSISNANQYLETTDLFVWTLVVILLSLLFEFLVKLVVNISSKKSSVANKGGKDL